MSDNLRSLSRRLFRGLDPVADVVGPRMTPGGGNAFLRIAAVPADGEPER